MRIKSRYLTFYFIAALVSSFTFGQELERAVSVYKSLEYNTTAFNDLKHSWILNDPLIVRQIFNKFIINRALRIDGKNAEADEINARAKEIYDGKIFVEFRQRYYDSEIEQLRFFTEQVYSLDTTKRNYFFDVTEDHLVIKEILGNDLYNNLQKKGYSNIDITKEESYSYSGYNFDIYLSLFDPEFLVYTLNTTSRKKYLFSLKGKWGNNESIYPGWYSPDYFAGIGLQYVDSIVNSRPYSSYRGMIALGFGVRQPEFSFNQDIYGHRLYRSGSSVYISVGGRPLKYFMPELGKIDITLDGFFTPSKFSRDDYGIDYLTKFYSIRNYFGFSATYTDLTEVLNLGLLDAGLGVNIHDLNDYYLVPGEKDLKSTVSSGSIKTNINIDASINKYSGWFVHNIGLQINYNFNDAYSYLGMKYRFLLNNTFGFDIRFYKAIKWTTNGVPFYRWDNYVTFSPLIRINY